MESLKTAREKINIIDREMAKLFEERMECAEAIAEYKKDRGLAIYDKAREEDVIRRNSEFITNPTIREYYVNFLKNNMAVSRSYQSRLMSGAKVAYSGTEGALPTLRLRRHSLHRKRSDIPTSFLLIRR